MVGRAVSRAGGADAGPADQHDYDGEEEDDNHDHDNEEAEGGEGDDHEGGKRFVTNEQGCFVKTKYLSVSDVIDNQQCQHHYHCHHVNHFS